MGTRSPTLELCSLIRRVSWGHEEEESSSDGASNQELVESAHFPASLRSDVSSRGFEARGGVVGPARGNIIGSKERTRLYRGLV